MTQADKRSRHTLHTADRIDQVLRRGLQIIQQDLYRIRLIPSKDRSEADRNFVLKSLDTAQKIKRALTERDNAQVVSIAAFTEEQLRQLATQPIEELPMLPAVDFDLESTSDDNQ